VDWVESSAFQVLNAGVVFGGGVLIFVQAHAVWPPFSLLLGTQMIGVHHTFRPPGRRLALFHRRSIGGDRSDKI
tara:strand:+ start:778 stop:999 length:222 start_codon:yes stop_codon:yes gene_type:complete